VFRVVVFAALVGPLLAGSWRWPPKPASCSTVLPGGYGSSGARIHRMRQMVGASRFARGCASRSLGGSVLAVSSRMAATRRADATAADDTGVAASAARPVVRVGVRGSSRYRSGFVGKISRRITRRAEVSSTRNPAAQVQKAGEAAKESAPARKAIVSVFRIECPPPWLLNRDGSGMPNFGRLRRRLR